MRLFLAILLVRLYVDVLLWHTGDLDGDSKTDFITIQHAATFKTLNVFGKVGRHLIC